MSTTKAVKILMIVLFGAAGLVLARVGILINKTFHPATAAISLPTKVDYEDSDDFDHDGLKNAEEAVWGSDPYNPDTDGDGYLDGEEVFSDHNPLVKEGDSLAEARNILAGNYTEKMSGLIIGGLMSGDLKNTNSLSGGSIKTLAETSVYSVLSALENANVPEEPRSTVENSKENEEQYIQGLFSVITSEITDLIYGQPQELVRLFSPDKILDENSQVFSTEKKQEIKERFLKHSMTFQAAADNLQSLAVPKGWENIHKKSTLLLKKLATHYRTIALSQDDPFKQMIVLGNLQKVYLETQPIMIAVNNKVKERDLKVPENDFFDISLLLNPFE